MRRYWTVGLVGLLILSVMFNALLLTLQPVWSQPEVIRTPTPEIVYIRVNEAGRTKHIALVEKLDPTGRIVDYQTLYLFGERWVLADSGPVFCDNVFDVRSAWMELPAWEQAHVREICEDL